MRFLVPALAIVLAVAVYWLVRTPDSESKAGEAPSENASASTKAPTSSAGVPTADGKAPPTPVRMRAAPRTTGIVAPIASTDSLADAYQTEPRDAEQAKIHDALIREVVETLAESKVGTAHIEALDCRSRHCRLQLASDDENGLAKLVDALGDERGFFGRAESMMLSRQDDDIVYYLRFAPPK